MFISSVYWSLSLSLRPANILSLNLFIAHFLLLRQTFFTISDIFLTQVLLYTPFKLHFMIWPALCMHTYKHPFDRRQAHTMQDDANIWVCDRCHHVLTTILFIWNVHFVFAYPPHGIFNIKFAFDSQTPTDGRSRAAQWFSEAAASIRRSSRSESVRMWLGIWCPYPASIYWNMDILLYCY